MAHMYVVLPSNSSTDYFPDNTLANFKVKLGKPLVLDGQYEVALVELIYPHRRLTVEPHEAMVTVHYQVKRKVKQKKIAKKDPKTNRTKWRAKGGKMEHMTEVISHRLQTKVTQVSLRADMYEDSGDLFSSLKEMDFAKMIWFHLEHGRFSIKMGGSVKKVKLSPRMAHLLGFTKNEKQLIITTSQEAKYMPHFEGSNHSLYIYSSIVDNQLVGDVVAPLPLVSVSQWKSFYSEFALQKATRSKLDIYQINARSIAINI